MFGDKHEVISIENYQMSSDKYMRGICKDHNSNIIAMCTSCLMCLCEKCDIPNGSCTGECSGDCICVNLVPLS